LTGGGQRPVRVWYRATAARVGATAARVGATVARLAGTDRFLRGGGRTARALRRYGPAVLLVLVTAAGMALGLAVGGHTETDVGPFQARFSLRPALTGGTDVQIPPLGSLEMRSHAGPAHLTVTLDQLDQRRTFALATGTDTFTSASEHAVADVDRGVRRLVLQATAAAVLGAMLLAALVYRRVRQVAYAGVLALATVAASGAIAVATFAPRSVQEPTYHGLLANAPAVIGDAKSIADRYTAYSEQLQHLVNNVTKLYDTLNALPVYQADPGTIRVLHISDLHLNPSAWPVIQTTVEQFGITLVVDTGDINDWGTPVESSFVDAIGTLGVPYVYIRGNHDSDVTARAVASQRNATVLENGVATVAGVTIAGVADPRFTPDKQTSTAPPPQERAELLQSGSALAATIGTSARPVDIALVHDPASATPLAGVVPLVLAGHLHARATRELPVPAGAKPTFLMVEGSTGGAGLRGLEHEEPTPLEMSVLYLDAATHALQAYDEITLGGTGRTEVTLRRHVVGQDRPDAVPSGSAGPSGSPTGPPGSPTVPGSPAVSGAPAPR